MLDWLDAFIPAAFMGGLSAGTWWSAKKCESRAGHGTIITTTKISTDPVQTAPQVPKSKAYTIGYTFQKEMLEADVKDTKISTYIEERTNPQGRYKNAKHFSGFEDNCKQYFGNYESWQGFKEKGTPKDVEDFNEGRHDATAEHYRAVANEMAFESSLERSDKSIASMEQGLQEVYLSHHHSIDAHDIFDEAFKRLEKREIGEH